MLAVGSTGVAAGAEALGTSTVAGGSQLLSAGLSQPIVYPSALPPGLGPDLADTSIHGDFFSVEFDYPADPSANLPRAGYVTFSRNTYRLLSQDLNTARRRGFRPKQKTVGSRRVFYICGHICGYEWHENNYTYNAFGIGYADRSPNPVLGDLRLIIQSLVVLS